MQIDQAAPSPACSSRKSSVVLNAEAAALKVGERGEAKGFPAAKQYVPVAQRLAKLGGGGVKFSRPGGGRRS